MSSATSRPTPTAAGQQHEDRRDAELGGQQRATVAGHAKEQRLAEAQYSGVAPDQVEGQREQPDDEDAGREQDPELVRQRGQDQERGQQHRLDPGDRAALLSAADGGHGRLGSRRQALVVAQPHSPGMTGPLLFSTISYLPFLATAVYMFIFTCQVPGTFAPATGTVGNLGVVEGLGHLLALHALGFLHRRLPQLEPAIHPGGRAARGERVVSGIELVVLGLDLVAARDRSRP